MSKEKTKKKTALEQSTINMRLYRFCARLFKVVGSIKYGFKVDKSAIKGMKGPFLVLGNHTSWVDFLYFSNCVYPHPMNVVVTSNVFYMKFLGKLFTDFGAIPKKQFTSDFSCIKHIKRNLDNGNSVLLFPEGRITVDGSTGYIAPSIGKLIKFLNCPVIKGITVGSYVTRPKWGKKRPGKVTLKMEPLLSTDDIGDMSNEEIYEYILKNFSYDDNVAFKEQNRKVYGLRLAETLEKLLYKCPRCGAEFKNVSKYRTFRCTACGNTVKYNTDGTLSPSGENDKCFEFVSEWYKFQRYEVKKEVENLDYSFEENVTLLLTDDKTHRFEEAGKGKIVLDKNGITYVGTKCGQEVSRTFGLKNHPTVAYKLAQNIEIAEDNEIFKFVFENGFHTAKFVLAVEELHKKYVENAK